MKNRGEAEILHRVVIGELKIVEAARILGYTTRTAYRRVKRFRAGGEERLVHGLIGRPSNRAKDEEIRDRTIVLFREMGKTVSLAKFVVQLREVEGIDICRESLRRWLLDAGLWVAGRREKIAVAPEAVRPAADEVVE